MAEPWSVEAEVARIHRTRHETIADAIRAGILAGLSHATAICGERANAHLASRMSDYRQGAFDEAEACEAAIKNEAK